MTQHYSHHDLILALNILSLPSPPTLSSLISLLFPLNGHTIIQNLDTLINLGIIYVTPTLTPTHSYTLTYNVSDTDLHLLRHYEPMLRELYPDDFIY